MNPWISKIIILIKEIFIPLISAGVGAWGGCYFNERHRKKNEFNNKINYINYSISILGAVLNQLLNLKTDILYGKELEEELNNIKKVCNCKDHKLDNNEGVTISCEIKNISKTYTSPDFTLPIDIEKLSFLTEYHMMIPTTFILLSDILGTINKAIQEHNELLKNLQPNQENININIILELCNQFERLQYITDKGLKQCILLHIVLEHCAELMHKSKRMKYNNVKVSYKDKTILPEPDIDNVLYKWATSQ